ncbi:MAG TPA: DUF1156 domain-containing protein [Methanocellales archaeon]|nr:DUF1156 domain-containing protein [Methanocellales archaeon]
MDCRHLSLLHSWWSRRPLAEMKGGIKNEQP